MDARDTTEHNGTKSALSDRQRSLILSLLSEPTVEAACKAAGVGRTTGYRWMAEPSFRAAMDAARQQAMDTGLSRLQMALCGAVTALEAVMGDPKANSYARVAAAKVVVDAAMRHTEVQEVRERLGSIEALLFRQRSGP